MSNKTEALIRELAALFVKYRLTDWAPLIEELERRGASEGLSEAIRRHLDDARPIGGGGRRSAKRPAARRGPAKAKPTQLELEPRFTGPNASTVEQLRQALISKTALPSLPSLKAVHASLGMKSAGNSRREALIAILTEHLDGLEGAGFEKALRTVAQEEERNAPEAVGDYDRWFQLITARKPGA